MASRSERVYLEVTMIARWGCLIACAFAWTLWAADEATSPAPLFADKNLEKAIRQRVFEKRNNDKPLVEADVAGLSVLKARGLGIVSLAGLEKCVSLAELDLASNKVSDLTPLKGLKILQTITLKNNQIEDISAL